MKRFIAVMSMAIGVSAAGVASAHDATKVIFDLSELHRHTVTSATPTHSSSVSMKTGSLPMSTPSSVSDGDSRLILVSGDNLEVRHRNGGGAPHFGGGRGPTPGGGKGGGTQAAPTPEPGTMMLLGSGLAAGARFLRRRSA